MTRIQSTQSEKALFREYLKHLGIVFFMLAITTAVIFVKPIPAPILLLLISATLTYGLLVLLGAMLAIGSYKRFAKLGVDKTEEEKERYRRTPNPWD